MTRKVTKDGEKVRRGVWSGGSLADSLESTRSLREDSSGTKSLEDLEKCGGWRTLCMTNKFEPLMNLCDDEDEEDWDVHHDDPKQSPDTWTVDKRKSKSGRNSKPKPVDEMDDEENTLHHANVPAPNNGKHTTHLLTQRSPAHRVQHRNSYPHCRLRSCRKCDGSAHGSRNSHQTLCGQSQWSPIHHC